MLSEVLVSFSVNQSIFICILLSHIQRCLRLIAQVNIENGDRKNQLGIRSRRDATVAWKNSPVLKHIRAEILKCQACCTPVENSLANVSLLRPTESESVRVYTSVIHITVAIWQTGRGGGSDPHSSPLSAVCSYCRHSTNHVRRLPCDRGVRHHGLTLG